MDAKIAKCVESFFLRGYGVIEEFLSEQEVEELKGEINRLLEEEIRSKEDQNENSCLNNTSQKEGVDSAFDAKLGGDKLQFFHNTELTKTDIENSKTIEEKKLLYSKIVNSLYKNNKFFNKTLNSDKVRKLYKALNYEDPVAYQDICFMKNAKNGTTVEMHQDEWYNSTDPLGYHCNLWFSLDNATAENGCLQFVPGSHLIPTTRRLIRNTNELDKETKPLIWIGEKLDEPDDSKFVKVEVKKGALIVLNCRVLHRSDGNKSDQNRWIYGVSAYDNSKAKLKDDGFLDVSAANLWSINENKLLSLV